MYTNWYVIKIVWLENACFENSCIKCTQKIGIGYPNGWGAFCLIIKKNE
jgi:hypothetical protein